MTARMLSMMLLLIVAAPSLSQAQDQNRQGAAGDAGAVIVDGLMWAPASNGEDVVWEAANSYCRALELDGHSDWRLPTLAEIESLHDPDNAANGHIVSPLQLEGCCLWSSTSLAELSAEELGLPGGQSNPASRYYWGFLFAGAVRYYSVEIFPDGQALCVRDYQ